MPLEEMGAFFDARVGGYEAHMLENVDGSDQYYLETARMLPVKPGLNLLDLGCGTGLELDELFKLQPDAHVTGIDLSAGMLQALQNKHAGRDLKIIRGSYFVVPFDGAPFDAVVSVQTMHHFAAEDKLRLYQKIASALAAGGVYIETDYVAPDDQYEHAQFCYFRSQTDGQPAGYYHIDIPFTIRHQLSLMQDAGFTRAELLWYQPNTAIMRASV